MKLKVKIKYSDLYSRLYFTPKGDWIDLKSAESIKGRPGDLVLGGLGVAMELPKGFEAIIAPRSSSPKKFGFLLPNSIGVIDNCYNGNEDEWKGQYLFFKEGAINRGDRVLQFRIQPSQYATVWQKLKWLFSSGIEFEEVESLNAVSRGGFGTTGKN